MKLFSGNANPKLAAEIAGQLGLNLGKITVSRFADGEVNVMVHENVRGKDVYIIQVCCCQAWGLFTSRRSCDQTSTPSMPPSNHCSGPPVTRAPPSPPASPRAPQ
jgi:phosphoribosylpyrophosphate synthetase